MLASLVRLLMQPMRNLLDRSPAKCTGTAKLVLQAMPWHAGNVHALSQLKQRANAGQFAGQIAAIVKYADEVELLRSLGADEVFVVDAEAGSALADDAGAGWRGKQARAPA